MLDGFPHRLAILLVALGVMMAGFAPGLGMASPMGAAARMATMPGMQGDCLHNAQGGSRKQMPCDGTDCGCCLAGTCAAPVALNQAGLVALLGRTLDQNIPRNTIPAGISFPPALPPPIA